MSNQRRAGSDAESFTRLIYYATVHLNRSEDEAWLMPLGHLLDLWECHCQFIGIRKQKQLVTIDDIVPWNIS